MKASRINECETRKTGKYRSLEQVRSRFREHDDQFEQLKDENSKASLRFENQEDKWCAIHFQFCNYLKLLLLNRQDFELACFGDDCRSEVVLSLLNQTNLRVYNTCRFAAGKLESQILKSPFEVLEPLLEDMSEKLSRNILHQSKRQSVPMGMKQLDRQKASSTSNPCSW